ncbi:MAG: hypothetical protein QW815_08130 [Nitrososphaerota archaeon]
MELVGMRKASTMKVRRKRMMAKARISSRHQRRRRARISGEAVTAAKIGEKERDFQLVK